MCQTFYCISLFSFRNKDSLNEVMLGVSYFIDGEIKPQTDEVFCLRKITS